MRGKKKEEKGEGKVRVKVKIHNREFSEISAEF